MLSHYRSVSAALDGPKHKSRPIAELHSLRPCFLAQFRYGPQRGNNALLLYSEDDLLDMDYFLNEDVFGDDFGDEGFYIF